MKRILFAVLVFLPLQIFAGAVDDCIDSLAGSKKKGCTQAASLTSSASRLCVDNGANCGPACERAPGGKCVVKGTLANLLANACRDGRNLSTADLAVCESDEVKFVELQ
jgi:hypothetical protein